MPSNKPIKGYIIKGGLQHITGICSFILHEEKWKRIKILQIFVKTLFFVFDFFSYSTETPLNMGPLVQQISVKKATDKNWKSIHQKIKITRIKALNFSEDLPWFGFHLHLAKKNMKFAVKTFCFLLQN